VTNGRARTVILVRHAHAEWPQYQGRDIDRPLTPQGEQDAHAAGRALRTAGHVPEVLLVSPARRTRQTAAIIATELGVQDGATRPVESLYNASPDTLAQELRRATGAASGLVMLVGHNPGISELGRRLSDGEQAAPFAPADWRVMKLPD
jgi:phosphohistidine phosphatase